MNWLLLVLLIAGLSFCWRCGRNKVAVSQLQGLKVPSAPPPKANIPEHSSSTCESDSDAYRFDGEAFPQYRITYADDDGSVTVRDIYINRTLHRNNIAYYRSWCFVTDEFRTFRSDRVLHSINLQTGRHTQAMFAHWLRE